MSRSPGPGALGPGPLGPGSTIRTRIALVFGGVFLVLGACLLGIVNLLSRAGTRGEAAAIALRETTLMEPGTVHQLTETVSDAASEQVLIWSAFALLGTAVCAVVVGWWTAGRVLRPVHEMTAKARRLSEHTLDRRIAVRGPDDELKELGDTIDALLARLEKAFDSQRRFIANASHELRTPLATQRAAIQVGLDDSGVKQVLLDTNRRSERLIDGLLLARSERGLEERDDVDLGEVVEEECERYGVLAEVSRGVVVRGNRLLLGQLVRNLVANAVTYNVPDGVVEVSVDVSAGGGLLTVTNTGPVVAASDVPGLFEPFRRGEGRDRMGPGAGLGLSIVRSIAVAHGGTVEAEPRSVTEAETGPGPEGGLVVRVLLPVPSGRASSS
ncbi:sensor histidine kinase [Streptomyces sp. NPDC059881]|uniref:sensor histidine kinase n=1 Tax=Streptomyces sp. NPDC059881 TaxID=3346986 RepID=UPI0036568640